MATECTHLDQIKIKHTSKHVCEECVKMGDKWVHFACVSPADTSAVAIRQRTSMPPSISMRPNIR